MHKTTPVIHFFGVVCAFVSPHGRRARSHALLISTATKLLAPPGGGCWTPRAGREGLRALPSATQELDMKQVRSICTSHVGTYMTRCSQSVSLSCTMSARCVSGRVAKAPTHLLHSVSWACDRSELKIDIDGFCGISRAMKGHLGDHRVSRRT